MSELQHPLSRSFENVAELYERTRPTYPAPAVDWLVEQLRIDADATVLDLGAGTGKLTRALVGRAGRVIAVEPGREMLAQLARAVPEADAILGAAEDIPLADDSVDAVVCGQSFHWFRNDEAEPEIRRVLRNGGGLGLIWNLRDPDDVLQNVITELIEPFIPASHGQERKGVSVLVNDTFGEVPSKVFRFEHELDADGVVERIASTSFVASASQPKRDDLETALRALVAEHGERIAFRYVTEAYAVLNVA